MPNNTTTFRTRNSLQVIIDSPRGLSRASHEQMLREAKMNDWTLGELLERMWAAYAASTAVPAPAVANGRRR